MKKLISFLLVLFLLSACQRTETVNEVVTGIYPKTQDAVKNEELKPTIKPVESIKNEDAGVSNPAGNFDSPQEYVPENEDIYKTGKYTGPLVRGVESDMLKPSFWLERYYGSDEIIMPHEKIEQYNEYNFKNLSFLTDFKVLPEKIKGAELLEWINELSIVPESTRYDENGNKYLAEDYKRLKENLNIGDIAENVNVFYGLAVRRTQMRTFPTYKPSLSSPSNIQFDYFTETAVYAAEPVLIYHTSADGRWYFAGIYNYRGWIPVKDVALCSKQDLIDYRSSGDLLVVKAPAIFTPESDDNRISRLQLDMGITLRVVSRSSTGYTVSYPVCNDNNYLDFAQLTIPFSEDASTEYPDYTVKNVLIQAFKFLGEPYGWGGMNNARDCSAFIADVYRSFGFLFPRNSNQQEKIKGNISFTGKSRAERFEILDSLKPGTPLYMPGHAMMYLGKWNNRHYIIHDVPTVYQRENDGKLTPIKLNQVSVTPLDVCNSKGNEYIMLLTTAVVIE